MYKKKTAISEGLSAYIRHRYEIAKDFKSSEGVTATLHRCVRLVRGDPIVELDEALPRGVVANIASPIARGVIGMLRDIYGQNTDSPFVLQPTPIVELPQSVKMELEQVIHNNSQQLLEAVGYDTKMLDMKLLELRELTLKLEVERAAKAAEKLSVVVEDNLIDAGWSKAFEHEALQHFVMFPAVIMKCPVYKSKRVKRWNGNNYESAVETVLTVETISPFNFYPSPNATDAQDADYVIERRRMTNTELRLLSARDGFDEDGVDRVLELYPEGRLEPYENGAEVMPTDEAFTTDVEKNPTRAYDTLGYFGAISGDKLELYGVQGIDPTRVYEAEVWVVGDVVIKAVLNPDVMGRRPFYVASFEPVPNSLWGECPMTRVAEHQRACTSAVAHLFRNISYSSGPLVERDTSRLVDDQEPADVTPYTIVDVKPNLSNAGGSAFKFHETQNKISELASIYDKFKAEAYDAIGIPKALFGGTDGMGTIGRTSGGIATVYAQGSKAIKYSMRLLEELIIEPIIQRIADEAVANSLDQSIKGDIQVRARGVSGIVEKDNRREQLNWAMQSLVPLMQITDADGQPVIPPDAPVRLLYEQFKALGIPTDGVFNVDYDKQDAVKADTGVPPEVVAQPTLDGRSPDAMAAIQAMGGAQMPDALSMPDMTGMQ